MIGELGKTEIHAIFKGLSRAMHRECRAEDYEAVMVWASAAKMDADLLELVLQGFIDPYVDDEGVLQFMPTELGLASNKRSELERMRA